MNIKKNITELIGNTPLVQVDKINTGKALIAAKLEFFNPLSSVKDRIALSMIEDAEKKGILKKGSVIIEPTSGNTGIGLAFVSAVKDYRLVLTMPDTMSIERRNLLRALGAELVLTEGSKGMKGAVDKAEELSNEIENGIVLQQFQNSANPEIHYKTTGPEIWDNTNGKVDIFVSGVGTGGTITGVGKFLKEKNPEIRIVAVEPEGSAVLSGNQPGSHRIQGIGAGFIPKILNVDVIDEIIQINDNLAGDVARKLAKVEGIPAGISAGAAMKAAIELSERKENKDKVIVVLLPDSGERYLSTWLYQNSK